MGKALSILLLFSFATSFAQWNNLGGFDTTTYMLSDGKGYSFRTQWFSPSSGYTHYFYKITNDKQASIQSAWNWTNDLASQKVSNLSFINDSLGVIATNCFMQFTHDECLTWELDFQLGPSFIVGGELKTIYLYSYTSKDESYYVVRQNPFMVSYSLLHRINADTMMYLLPVKFTEYKQLIFINDSTGFLIADDFAEPSTLLRTENSGQSFTEMIVDDDAKLNNMCFPSEKVGYICANKGKVYKTKDAGVNWTSTLLPTDKNMRAIAFMNDSVGYVAGEDSLIYKTMDGGITWKGFSSSIKPFPSGNYVTRLFHFKNDVAYAVHSKGYLEKNQVPKNPITKIQTPSEFTIYPNPVVDVLELSYPDLSQSSSVFLYNALGQLVYWQNLSGNHASILISEFPAGVYYMLAEHNGSTYKEKFIKTYEE